MKKIHLLCAATVLSALSFSAFGGDVGTKEAFKPEVKQFVERYLKEAYDQMISRDDTPPPIFGGMGSWSISENNYIEKMLTTRSPEEWEKLYNEKRESDKAFQELASKIDAFNQEHSSVKITNCDQESCHFKQKIKDVQQAYLGYISAQNQSYLIGTYGARPCFIILAHNPQSQRAALCHMDVPDLKVIHEMLRNLRGDQEAQKLEIYLAGGDSKLSNLKETETLINYIQKDPLNVVVYSSISDSKQRSDSLTFNMQDKTIYRNVANDHFEDEAYGKRVRSKFMNE